MAAPGAATLKGSGLIVKPALDNLRLLIATLAGYAINKAILLGYPILLLHLSGRPQMGSCLTAFE